MKRSFHAITSIDREVVLNKNYHRFEDIVVYWKEILSLACSVLQFHLFYKYLHHLKTIFSLISNNMKHISTWHDTMNTSVKKCLLFWFEVSIVRIKKTFAIVCHLTTLVKHFWNAVCWILFFSVISFIQNFFRFPFFFIQKRIFGYLCFPSFLYISFDFNRNTKILFFFFLFHNTLGE